MSHNEFNRNLRLDRVVTSQPELGPSVPDGGYGWIILIASLILQVLIPSIITSFGIFMLYSRIELSAITDDPWLWDVAILPTPIVFVAFKTLSDPWSKTIVATSTWPRLVTTSGIFLICAGLLIQWLAMREPVHIIVYMIAGTLSGFGSSLTITQCETLIAQYFRLKLATVNNLLICGYSLGFTIVPIILGILLLKKGILHTLLVYQTIIVQCALVVLVFKKPDYLKARRRRYELLQTASEDDEMIFAKDETGIEQDVNLPSTSNTMQSTSSNIESTITKTDSLQEKNTTLLTDSFVSDKAYKLDRNQSAEDAPNPLYTEIDITQDNTLYTFDNNVTSVDDNMLFTAPPSEQVVATNFIEEIRFLRRLSFYKSLFLLIGEKYSFLIFWTLFPTYLYTDMTHLKVQQTTFLVGAMGLGSLFIGLFSSFLPVFGSNKQTVTSLFCFLSSTGYFILSDAGTEGWLLFGALLITTSITEQHVLYPSIIKQTLGIDCEKAHTLLYTLTGISLLLLLIRDTSYKSCFRIMALLQLISSILLFFNFLYKHFKRLCTR